MEVGQWKGGKGKGGGCGSKVWQRTEGRDRSHAFLFLNLAISWQKSLVTVLFVTERDRSSLSQARNDLLRTR